MNNRHIVFSSVYGKVLTELSCEHALLSEDIKVQRELVTDSQGQRAEQVE